MARRYPVLPLPGQDHLHPGLGSCDHHGSSFMWQRKTGKKFYAYVTNDDGSTTSNRVIIPAS